MLNNANFFNKVPHRGLGPLIPATEPESHKIADQVCDEVYPLFLILISPVMLNCHCCHA